MQPAMGRLQWSWIGAALATVVSADRALGDPFFSDDFEGVNANQAYSVQSAVWDDQGSNDRIMVAQDGTAFSGTKALSNLNDPTYSGPNEHIAQARADNTTAGGTFFPISGQDVAIQFMFLMKDVNRGFPGTPTKAQAQDRVQLQVNSSDGGYLALGYIEGGTLINGVGDPPPIPVEDVIQSNTWYQSEFVLEWDPNAGEYFPATWDIRAADLTTPVASMTLNSHYGAAGGTTFTTQDIRRVALQLNTAREGDPLVPMSEPSVYVDDFSIVPFVAPELFGDFNDDNLLNATDIDMLCAAMHNGGPADPYDLNDDELVDMGDLTFHVQDIIGTTLGDADTDLDVDLDDLTSLATYYGQTSGQGWANGDFDCDGDVDLVDLTMLATHYGAGQTQAFADFANLSAVPEPAGLLSAGFLIGIAAQHRRRCR